MIKYACGNEVRAGDIALRFDSNDGVLAVGEYVVDGIQSGCNLVLNINGVQRIFSAEYFKLISRKEETTTKTKQFTKADLKTGMRVTTANGKIWTVMKGVPAQGKQDEGIFVYDRGWMDIKGLNEGFVYSTDRDYSLVKVEQVDLYCDYLSTSCDTTVLWEREAPKSKEQIAYDEAVEATEAARQAYELAQKKLEALNPSK